MTMSATAGRKRPVRFNWYNPFAAFEARKDAEVAVKMGGGMALAVQGLGVIITLIRLVPALQHATGKALYAAWASMAVVVALGFLLTVTGFALNRRQAVWAAIVLATMVGLGAFLQLGHGWVSLLRAPNLMSIGGAILCVRGALALKRQKVDLNEVFS